MLARPKKERGPRPGRARPRRRLGPARGDRGVGLRRPRRRVRSPGSTRTGSRPSSATRTTSSPSWRRCARRGVRTIGRFVWEHFTAEHVAGAREAFDVVYSLTHAEQERYAEMGLETPVRRLGLPPGADRGGRRGRRSQSPSDAPRRRHASSSPAASSATASRSSRCSRRSRRPTTRACGWSSRPRSSASRCGAAEDAAERDPRIELRARRPADRRAPARARELRRLPRPGALGGPRAAALRGDRVRPCRRSPTTRRR